MAAKKAFCLFLAVSSISALMMGRLVSSEEDSGEVIKLTTDTYDDAVSCWLRGVGAGE